MGRILVVDDEKGILEGFQAALAQAGGHQVETANSGEEGLQKLRDAPYDMAFFDIRMPGMDGLTLLKAARPLRPDTDIVMMTGYSSVDTAVDAMKVGAVDYIQKPFSQEELLAHIRKVERSRADRIRRREEEQGFERFTSPMLVQHWVLIVTFTLLSVTGIPLLFPDVFKGVFFFEDSSLLRGLLHRVSAVGLILLSVYHVGYLLFTDDGHFNIKMLLPRIPADVKEFFLDLAYVVGLRDHRPPADRYNWYEKFEYFAVVWGSLIMILSGFVLWFTDPFLRVFPLWVLDVAKVVHRYEAILAILSIVVWHMYTVHLRPGVFPMSRVWLTGRISRDEMIHHHPVEYERVTGRRVDHPSHATGTEVRS
jgi:formate dehydrogenase gamma subunit